MEATGQFHRKFDQEFFADGFFAAASEKTCGHFMPHDVLARQVKLKPSQPVEKY
jgi:hypothetical protein